MPKSLDSKDVAETIRWSPRASRREFLTYMGAALAATACGSGSSGSDDDNPVPPAPIIATNPFTLGVASGDPLAESVILWTRLATDPLDGGGMDDVEIPVVWEVALDADFRQIIRSGWVLAAPALGHSIHIDADGLGPDTWYWYRFRIDGQWTSAAARTRTLPAPGTQPASFRIISASCQSYPSGYYTAHAHIAAEDVDLVTFLGDYIYEGAGGSLRAHVGPLLRTLTDYRNRYAQYRLDPNLQAAHHRCPWMVTWDDHEVANNYADQELPGNRSNEDGLALRRNAYQAYYEHMPLRIPKPDDFGFMDIYRSVDIGDLIRLYVLDGRQYRTPQPCNGQFVRCAEVDDPSNTMLGTDQRAWLEQEMESSSAIWNFIAQQTVFSPTPLGPTLLNPDQWDGYPVERQALMTLFRSIRNVVIATGDIHLAGMAVLHAEPTDLDSEVVAHEFVTTSISSGGDSGDDLVTALSRAIQQLRYVRYVNNRRGYILYEWERDRMRAHYRFVETVMQEESDSFTDAIFEVEADTKTLTRLL